MSGDNGQWAGIVKRLTCTQHLLQRVYSLLLREALVNHTTKTDTFGTNPTIVVHAFVFPPDYANVMLDCGAQLT